MRGVLRPLSQLSTVIRRARDAIKRVMFAKLRIPFGCEVIFMPQTELVRGKTCLRKSRGRQGVFLGWHLLPGGVRSGDYYFADALGHRSFQESIHAGPDDVRRHIK